VVDGELGDWSVCDIWVADGGWWVSVLRTGFLDGYFIDAEDGWFRGEGDGDGDTIK
jgi:hypothetical protein